MVFNCLILLKYSYLGLINITTKNNQIVASNVKKFIFLKNWQKWECFHSGGI